MVLINYRKVAHSHNIRFKFRFKWVKWMICWCFVSSLSECRWNLLIKFHSKSFNLLPSKQNLEIRGRKYSVRKKVVHKSLLKSLHQSSTAPNSHGPSLVSVDNFPFSVRRVAISGNRSLLTCLLWCLGKTTCVQNHCLLRLSSAPVVSSSSPFPYS